MDIAFDRAATELRRPSIYTVTADIRGHPAHPDPGTDADSRTDPDTRAHCDTEPTDGSLRGTATPEPDGIAREPPNRPGVPPCRRRKARSRSSSTPPAACSRSWTVSTRADIAKTSLIDLVTNTIPAGTTVSLRTFGDTPDSCDTILVVPRHPRSIRPRWRDDRQPADREPGANPDRGVAGGGRRRPRHGSTARKSSSSSPTARKPATAIRPPRSRHWSTAASMSASTSSASRSTMPPSRHQFAEWAQIGNGQYIDAGNAEELDQAVAQAVLPDLRRARRRRRGDRQRPGRRRPDRPSARHLQVVIRTDPEIVIDEVTIASGEETEVELPMP